LLSSRPGRASISSSVHQRNSATSAHWRADRRRSTLPATRRGVACRLAGVFPHAFQRAHMPPTSSRNSRTTAAPRSPPARSPATKHHAPGTMTPRAADHEVTLAAHHDNDDTLRLSFIHSSEFTSAVEVWQDDAVYLSTRSRWSGWPSVPFETCWGGPRVCLPCGEKRCDAERKAPASAGGWLDPALAGASYWVSARIDNAEPRTLILRTLNPAAEQSHERVDVAEGRVSPVPLMSRSPASNRIRGLPGREAGKVQHERLMSRS